MVSFLKISENHEKFVEKVNFYSSISLSGSGSGLRIRIRIQPGDLNSDPPGSATLLTSHFISEEYASEYYRYWYIKSSLSETATFLDPAFQKACLESRYHLISKHPTLKKPTLGSKCKLVLKFFLQYFK